MESAIDSVNLDEFMHILSAVNQEEHKSRIPSLNYNQSSLYWVFRNMDFKQWSSATCSQTLWLSGPPKCSIRRVSSYVVDVEKEKASEVQRYVLYFFCSTADTRESIVVSFVHTLLYQVICYSPPNEKAQIAKTFLCNLLDAILRKQAFDTKLRVFRGGDCPSAIIKSMLDAGTDGLWRALGAVLDEHVRELSMVIDGLDEVEHQKVEFTNGVRALIAYLQERTLKFKALLTSRPEADIKKVLGGLPYIEYDKERKG